MMPNTPRPNVRLASFENLGRLGIDLRTLETAKVRELTNIERAKLLRVPPEGLGGSVELTPGKPRVGNSFLTFYGACWVNSDPALDNATFTTAQLDPKNFPSPGIRVGFAPLKENAAHLVEFKIFVNNSTPPIKLEISKRSLTTPATIETISFAESQVVAVVIGPYSDAPTPTCLEVRLTQKNDPGEDAMWILQSVRLSSVS